MSGTHTKKRNTVLLHAQQVHPLVGNPSRRSVLLDVFDDQEHELVARAAGSNVTSVARRDKASMLRLDYVPLGRNGFREGSWYEIDLKFFTDIRYEPVPIDAPGASYLGGTLTAPPTAINASQFLIARRYFPGPTGIVDIPSAASGSAHLLLTVVDCGQGNWNEVRTKTTRLIYDLGACRYYKPAEVRALVASRNLLSEHRHVVVVLSHWDIDHYHALLEFTAPELSKISHVYAPDRLPDTATFKRVRALLSANGVPLTLLATQPHPNGKGPIQLVPISTSGPFTFFRATTGSSTNQTGIVVQVEGSNKIALLTGDHYYGKVLDASLPIKGKACELVIPHHGGICGSLNHVAWLAKHQAVRCVISVGNNPWGHPLPKYVGALKAIQGGKDPWRTDKSGSYRKLL